eukprot:8778793-Alexandrium_andersonii.AAC.1
MHGAGEDARERDIEKWNEIDEGRKPIEQQNESDFEKIESDSEQQPEAGVALLASQEPAEQCVAAPS